MAGRDEHPEQLAAAFTAALPAALRAVVEPDVGDQLAALIARARREAPGVALDPCAFVAHVAERVAVDTHGRPKLGSLHAGDLWIAFGCVIQERSAIAAFETRFAPEIRGALTRSFELALADDAELRLRERLMLVAGDDVPRLASYAGRGDLGAWLRAAAVRTAIDLMRARREIASDAATIGDIEAVDPLLASLKQRYRDEFRAAFTEAARQLTDRERTLLRYRFLDDLSIDEIGVVYRVHRATVARWIAGIRESLFEETRRQLMSRLTISEGEADSVLRLIDSQLDVSIGAVIR